MLECRLGVRQLLHDRLEAVLGVVFEIDASQVEVAQRVFDGTAAFFRRIARKIFLDGGVGTLQVDVLRHFCAVLGQQRQGLFVGLAPVRRSEYALQVTDR